ncbi:MAG: hypothetical protein HYU41_25065 [Candidatus Rokubacteria bacterium]|nr:hypothetical protein [Candidatus Rokubacteria bacterium]
MTFSGGSYDEITRWLWNFLTSHAKRVDPRIEILVEAGDGREGKSYGARFRIGDRLGPVSEFDFAEVAANRGGLAWCTALAERTKERARIELEGVAAAGAR